MIEKDLKFFSNIFSRHRPILDDISFRPNVTGVRSVAYKSDKWDDWMRRSLDGDRNAYRLLLESLRGWLMAYFGKRLKDRGEIEDLVQDTLLTLHAKRQTYDPSQPAGPWLAALARHRLMDHFRSRHKVTWVELDEEISDDNAWADPTAQHDVQRLLKTLPAAQAEVITQVKLQERSIDEVAQRTGHSPSSVKVMIHRGMKRLMASVKGSREND